MWEQHRALAVPWHPLCRLHPAEEVQPLLLLGLQPGRLNVAVHGTLPDQRNTCWDLCNAGLPRAGEREGPMPAGSMAAAEGPMTDGGGHGPAVLPTSPGGVASGSLIRHSPRGGDTSPGDALSPCLCPRL